MSTLSDQGTEPGETTYEQVNAKCQIIDWPEKTEVVLGCNVIPSSAEMSEKEFRDVSSRFWNEYVYPNYQKVYFSAFPEDRRNVVTPQAHQQQSVLDYNRKMIVALCDWLNSVYENERIAYLLNGLLSRCIESRNRERKAAKWAVGFGVSAAVLAVLAGVTAFSLLSAN